MATVPPLIEAIINPAGTSAPAGFKQAIDKLRFINPTKVSNRRYLSNLYREKKHTHDLYRALSEFLEDPDNARFILYCPLRLLPCQSMAEIHFGTSYIKAFVTRFIELLEETDLIADFTDGDVPVGKSKDNDFIVQAARLVPYLDKSILNSEQTLLADKVFAANEDKIAFPCRMPPFTSKYIETYISQYLEKVTLTDDPKRNKWLLWEYTRIAKNHLAKVFSDYPSVDRLHDLYVKARTDNEIEVLALAAARSQIKHYDPDNNKFITFLMMLGDNYPSQVVEAFKKLYNRNMIQEGVLKDYKIKTPYLTSNFIKNVSGADVVATTGTLLDKELLTIIYPVVMRHGSQIKGYSSDKSDTDLAVFIKPGIKSRELVNYILDKKFGTLVTQYWLQDNDGCLMIQDFDTDDPRYGSGADASIFLGSVWSGNDNTINDLYERFVLPYLKLPNPTLKKFYGRQMERYFLQYRLLHRGYEANYFTETYDTFLDNGYRELASQLFIDYAFVP